MISEPISHEAGDGYLIPVASTAPVQTAVPIQWLGDTPIIPSTFVSNRKGTQHKNERATIRKYSPHMAATPMGAPKETTVRSEECAHKTPNLSLPLKRSTKPQTIFLLTEEQALFLCSLGRNSEQIVQFKIELVLAFAEERRRKARTMPAIDVARLVEYEQRLSDLERQLDQYRTNQQQAAQLLLNVDRSSEAVPEETMRMKIQRIVNGYCQAKGQMQSFVWSHVYEMLYTRYRVRIQAYKKGKRETLLSVAERIGQLSNVYAIVSSELHY